MSSHARVAGESYQKVNGAGFTSFSHIGPGYAFSGKRGEVMAKRLAYIKKHGASFLFDGSPPPAKGWPEMPVAGQKSWSRAPSPAKNAMLLDTLADYVSEGRTIKEAAACMGISQQYGSKLWRQIVASLGAQAQ